MSGTGRRRRAGNAEARGGAEARCGWQTMVGPTYGGIASGERLEGEIGYGLPVGSRLVGTPWIGFGTSECGRDYRVG